MRWRFLPLASVILSLPLKAAEPGPTFYKDVAPILQQRCQSCHRAGEIGPMPLLTYEQARPWAKAIRTAVLLKRMPPWFADPQHGEFLNDRTVPPSEIETLAAWADRGAPAGDPAEAREPREFVDGWSIGEPDYIVEIPTPFHVPASGEVAYQYIVFPTGLSEDKWVKAVEVRPGNRAVVHHQIATVRPHEDEEPFEHGKYVTSFRRSGTPSEENAEEREKRRAERRPEMFADRSEQLQVYVPGGVAPNLLDGQARLVKAGSDFLFQLHYTTTGKEETDVTRIGFVFADKPPQRRVRGVLVYNTEFTIPPGDANALVMAQAEVLQPVELISMLPHMHLRGEGFSIPGFLPRW